MGDSSPKLFTLEEANALIPRLEMVMERMQRRGIELREAIGVLATEMDRPPSESEIGDLMNGRADLAAAAVEVEELIDEIEAYGAQFKGIDLGLVDFPAELDGQLVLLCWQYGEKEITHWHTEDTGFAARQSLPSVDQSPTLQ